MTSVEQKKTTKIVQEKYLILAQKIEKQLLRLLAFVEPKNSEKLEIEFRVLKIVDDLMSNSDIFLDKIEQFNEYKKKLTYAPKEESLEICVSSFQGLRSQAQNDIRYPFIPVIVSKPHAILPLSSLISEARANPSEFFRGIINPENYEFEHPYEKEINCLAIPSYAQLDALFSKTILNKFLTGGFLFIDNEQTLLKSIEEINRHNILSVDLEFHLIHSFQGYTCLLQMSTSESDYIFDTLKIYDKLCLLNTVLANPNILKIFHGCDSDINMLQKDFGLYVVNMLDTFQIAKRMHHNSNSLASLL